MPPDNVFQRPGPRRAAPLPATTVFEIRRALMLHQSGRVAEAATIYETVLAAHPEQFDCLHYLGVARLQSGRADQALPLLDRAQALQAGDASLQSNRGLALASLGRPADALRALDRALALKPGMPEALNNKGWALRALHRYEEALAAFDAALAANPRFAEVHARRAVCLAALHRHDEALAAFRRALELRPDEPDTLGNLGTLLTLMGRGTEAREALAQASTRAPRAIEHRLKHAVAWIPLVRGAGEGVDDARAAFEAEVRALLGEIEAGPVTRPDEAVGVAQPFYLAYQPRNNVALLSLYGDLCVRLMGQWQAAQAAGAAPDAAPIPASERPARVRVGIVSSHVFAHSVWQALVRGWVAELDRERFEVVVFHLGTAHDEETEFAQARADRFVRDAGSLAAWVAAIRDARCDILLYPEIGMDALTPRLASLRLAPVQAASWGHPETTGLPTLDHYLSAERFETEPGPLEASAPSPHYRESLVRLPGVGCCVAPTAVRPATHAVEVDLGSIGVAPGATLFVCAGTPFKYAPEFDDVLVRIARGVPGAQFVFFRTTQVPALADRLLARLSQALREAGLDPSSHLVLAPWLERARFLGVLAKAHVFLDTIGFSGFNTVMQAVECALPVVTMRGDFLRGRLGSGLLEHLGLDDLVAPDVDGYVDLALRLAGVPPLREAVRERLGQARTRMYGDTAPIRALEAHLLRWAGR